MPELILDLAVAKRGRINLAIGDSVGSNLANLTLVLGVVLLSSSFVAVDLSVLVQIVPFLLATTLILWRYLAKGGITQLGGIALIVTYIVFAARVTS
jgi:cation:H+ antiporter